MTLPEMLVAVWEQALVEGRQAVELEGESYRVKRTRQGLALVEFAYGPHRLTGIEQNLRTKSRWAKLAQQGKRIMQFSHQHRYIANVAEGRLTRYPAWHGLGLPA